MSESKESSAPEAPGPEPALESPTTPVSAGATRAMAPTSAGRRPTFVFFGGVAAVSLLLDVVTKAWAEIYFNRNLMGHSVQVVDDHLALVLAYNKGGAWGLGHGWSDTLRLPFFLVVSVAAIAFIVSLYSRLLPRQHALKWGLPLVLGGALGNLTDRIVRNQVIDFIDYRADWVRSMNEGLAQLWTNWSITDHWPTFNVADVAICAGVGLMAVDMLMSRRGHHESLVPQASAPSPAGPSETQDASAVASNVAPIAPVPPRLEPGDASVTDAPASGGSEGAPSPEPAAGDSATEATEATDRG
jgi:signal peptidase II